MRAAYLFLAYLGLPPWAIDRLRVEDALALVLAAKR